MKWRRREEVDEKSSFHPAEGAANNLFPDGTSDQLALEGRERKKRRREEGKKGRSSKGGKLIPSFSRSERNFKLPRAQQIDNNPRLEK